MARNIKVKISEREYSFTVANEEDEEVMRLAAIEVNKIVDGYLSKYPGRSMVDILSFAAINGWISSMRHKRVLDGVSGEATTLNSTIENYLEDIGKDR